MDIDNIVKLLQNAKRHGYHIYIMGNGGSSALAAHFTADLMKLGGCKAHDLSCSAAVLTMYANDNSYENVFVEQLKVYTEPGDVIIVISGSGNSPNVVNAVQWANDNGVDTIGFVGMTGGRLHSLLDYYIHVNDNSMANCENSFSQLIHEVVTLLK